MVSGGIIELHLWPSQGIQVRSSLVKTDWNSAPKTHAFSIDGGGGAVFIMSNCRCLINRQKGLLFPCSKSSITFSLTYSVFSFQCFFGALFPDRLMIYPVLCPLRFPSLFVEPEFFGGAHDWSTVCDFFWWQLYVLVSIPSWSYLASPQSAASSTEQDKYPTKKSVAKAWTLLRIFAQFAWLHTQTRRSGVLLITEERYVSASIAQSWSDMPGTAAICRQEMGGWWSIGRGYSFHVLLRYWVVQDYARLGTQENHHKPVC